MVFKYKQERKLDNQAEMQIFGRMISSVLKSLCYISLTLHRNSCVLLTIFHDKELKVRLKGFLPEVRFSRSAALWDLYYVRWTGKSNGWLNYPCAVT